MVTSIQLGNFFSSGGKTVLGGVGGSGLDTEGLIKSLTEAKRLPAVKLEDTITANGKKTDALAEFKTLVSAVKDAASFLRNPPGVGNQAQNAFLYTTASVTTNTGVTASNYMTVTTSPGVSPATYNISEITSVAKAKQQGTGDITIATADTDFVTGVATAGRFTAGNVTINGKVITFAAGDSMNDVASKLNARSSDLGFTTSVIKVSNGVYRFAFTATATGEDADFDLNDSGFVTSGAAVFNGTVFQLRQNADNAVFTINGVEITRQTNTVNDVFDGVTFNILQETPQDTTIAATVTADTSIVKNAVINFINAYNDLRIFAAKQMEVGDDGQYVEGAVLSSSSTFRNTVSSITSTLSQIVSGITGDDPSRLSDVGLTFADLPQTADNPQVRNILDLNEGTLMSKLSENYEAFRKVFEFDLESNNPDLRVFSRSNALGAENFTLTINANPPALPTVTALYNNGSGNVSVGFDVTEIKDNTNGEVLGYTLKGRAGTAFEGLQLIYANTNSATIAVTATQGLADRIFNIADNTLADSGSLATELDSIESADTRLEDQISRIDEQVERYRQQLLDKFAQLEQAISRVNSLLASIDAQNQTRYSA